MKIRSCLLVLLLTLVATAHADSFLSLTNQSNGEVWQGTVQSVDWMDTSPFTVFMQGFGLVFVAGLLATGARWVRKIFGGSSVEEQ